MASLCVLIFHLGFRPTNPAHWILPLGCPLGTYNTASFPLKSSFPINPPTQGIKPSINQSEIWTSSLTFPNNHQDVSIPTFKYLINSHNCECSHPIPFIQAFLDFATKDLTVFSDFTLGPSVDCKLCSHNYLSKAQSILLPFLKSWSPRIKFKLFTEPRWSGPCVSLTFSHTYYTSYCQQSNQAELPSVCQVHHILFSCLCVSMLTFTHRYAHTHAHTHTCPNKSFSGKLFLIPQIWLMCSPWCSHYPCYIHPKLDYF